MLSGRRLGCGASRAGTVMEDIGEIIAWGVGFGRRELYNIESVGYKVLDSTALYKT